MPKENCLIVRAAGKQLDLLRGEASRKELTWAGGPTARRLAPISALKILSQKRDSHSPATASALPARTGSHEKPADLMSRRGVYADVGDRRAPTAPSM